MANWRKSSICLLGVLMLTVATAQAALSLGVLAGTGQPGAKDGALLQAEVNAPYGLTLDREGNLLIADSGNNLIRRMVDGKLVTVAGSNQGTDAFGNPQGGLLDGQALQAMFNHPRGLAVDGQGNIYVADTGNHCIRRISQGSVRTFAGNGESGYANGAAAVARFDTPSSIVVDSQGNLLVADTLNNVIRKVTPAGVVSTFAGLASTSGGYLDGSATLAQFNEPTGLALSPFGDLLVVDSGNQLIRQVRNGAVSTLAGTVKTYPSGANYPDGGFADGSALTAEFNFPKGICVADNGTILVADTWNRSLRAITAAGEVLTLAGHGASGSQSMTFGELSGPVGLVYQAGHLYVSDWWNNLIYSLAVDLANLQAVEPEVTLGDAEQPGVPPERPIIAFDQDASRIQVWLDGQRVAFPDVQPIIAGGRTQVPLRFICEQWGATVNWESGSGQATVTRGASQLSVSGTSGQLDTTSNGQTMVELRFLAEKLGFTVTWEEEQRAVVIWTK